MLRQQLHTLSSLHVASVAAHTIISSCCASSTYDQYNVTSASTHTIIYSLRQRSCTYDVTSSSYCVRLGQQQQVMQQPVSMNACNRQHFWFTCISIANATRVCCFSCTRRVRNPLVPATTPKSASQVGESAPTLPPNSLILLERYSHSTNIRPWRHHPKSSAYFDKYHELFCLQPDMLLAYRIFSIP